MQAGAGEDGVTAVPLGGVLAAFAGAAAAPARQPAAALAAGAAEWLAARLGRRVPVLYAEQRHTALTFVYGHEGVLAPGPHAVGICDALITGEPDVALLVATADCLPVALAGAGVAAIVHAGWRGLAADVLGAALSRLRAELGVAAAELDAAIGVGIGPCHYPVGAEVADELARHDTGAGPWRCGGAVDLGAFAAGRLVALGVGRARIHRVPGCTACSPALHSHRRDGAGAGRQWSLVIRPRSRSQPGFPG